MCATRLSRSSGAGRLEYYAGIQTHGMNSACGLSMEHEITTARRWRVAYSLVFSLMVAVVVALGFFFTRAPV